MTRKKTKGVTLLLAVFISTMALTLGIGVFTLVYGQLRLSGTTKESFKAFYAADSGVECALYWDFTQNAFSAPGSINCGGNSYSVGGGALTKFDLALPNGACAKVSVFKSGSETTVTSLGENLSCGAAPSNRTVQRGLEVKY